MQRIKVIDSHTGGEPTRIVIDGGPELGHSSLSERAKLFREKFDEFRTAVILEPRGSEVLVGGLLCQPSDPSCKAGIIFFDNAGVLGMCGHGTIGLMATLRHLGRIEAGRQRIETPVGTVSAELFENGEVAVENVPSYRLHKDISVEVDEYGTVTGDIAWGGNWFFLVKNSLESLTHENTDHLTRISLQIRSALWEQSFTGAGGEPVEHVELFGPPVDANNDSRNFVLCPGGAYDRSPCGTGTSAKLACLAADGILAPGQAWRQESIVGSVFTCTYQPAVEKDHIVPTIRGTAHICGEATLILDPADPFCMGIRA